MNQNMAEYLNAMTLGDLDSLEEIISHQYRKFVRFYKLVKKFSSAIVKLKYEFGDASSLSVVLTMESASDAKELKSYLDKTLGENDYEGSASVNKKTVNVSVILQEA